MVYVIQVCWQLASGIRMELSSILIPLASCVYSEKLLMVGQRKHPKHVEFHSKINFRNWCIWLVYYKEICHDARSHECLMHVHDSHMDNTKPNVSLFCSVWSPLKMVNLIFSKYINLIFSTHIRQSLRAKLIYWFFFPLLCSFQKKESLLTLRRLMSYIYGAPILDVSRSHTTTQHSR